MKIICKICNQEISKRNFKKHIQLHNITEKEYYDVYIRTENEGICPTCGSSTKFNDIWTGYSKHCNTRCSAADPEVIKKKNNTMINTYGFTSHFSDKSTQQKIKQSYINNFGVDNPAKAQVVKDKITSTCMKKYGVSSALSSNIVKDKIKSTMLKQFGVDNAFKSKELMKNAYTPEARLKAIRTFKKRGNYSALENFLETELVNHNIKFIAQYNKDLRYPYKCDFYLLDADIFVEINAFWTHGGHWYDSSNLDDVNLLNYYKSNIHKHSMYEAAVRIWSESDVKKRKLAKQNNLNYVVLWNEQDIIDWINSNFEIRHDY